MQLRRIEISAFRCFIDRVAIDDIGNGLTLTRRLRARRRLRRRTNLGPPLTAKIRATYVSLREKR